MLKPTSPPISPLNVMRFKKTYGGREVLVTGGLGFIGSNLVCRLVETGAKVTVVDSLIAGYGGNLYNIRGVEDQIDLNVADVRDSNAIRYHVRNKDYLFNLAGQVSHIDSMLDPMTDLDINCRSQLSILEACRNCNPELKIIFASTRQLYGKTEDLPVDEDHMKQPVDVNGINKMAGEWYHILYNNVYGIRSVSLRLTNTYGPGQLMKHNRQGFAYWFTRLALEDRKIKVFGDGHQLRDFTYVDDVVEAFLLAGESGEADGEIFNLGGERPYSIREFVEVLIDVCGQGSYALVPFPEGKKAIDMGDYYADYSKIERRLGWRPEISLEEGLRRTVDYYRKSLEHYV